MTAPITVTFSGELTDKIVQLASLRKQEVSEMFESLVYQALPEEAEDVIDLTEPDEAVEHEINAYHALHKALWERYPGYYVAIHGGQLVDLDSDRVALGRRIDNQFPDEFVLLRKVESTPERTLYFHSPRFVENE